MIGRLSGILLEKNPPQLLLDVQGVAYEVDVPMSTFYNLPQNGDRVALFTHLVVREDAHLLYGFGTESERRAFRQLLKVNGIGAKIALSVLSGLSVTELAQAITLQETARLTRVPGIGKKTAERLLLELKDKLGADLTQASGINKASPATSDILNALLALGTTTVRRLAPSKRFRRAWRSPTASSRRSACWQSRDEHARPAGFVARPIQHLGRFSRWPLKTTC